MNRPRPSSDNGKMQGHMIELKRPQETMAHIATCPWEIRVVITSSEAIRETKASAFCALIFCRAKKPMIREASRIENETEDGR